MMNMNVINSINYKQLLKLQRHSVFRGLPREERSICSTLGLHKNSRSDALNAFPFNLLPSCASRSLIIPSSKLKQKFGNIQLRKFSSSSVACDSIKVESLVNDIQQQQPELKSKDDILHAFVNRNPRNLEMMRIARKPQGYHLEAKPPTYWYRVELNQRGGHTSAMLRHHSGQVVVSASTKEWAVQSRMPSTVDHTAAITIASLLARRCLEAGYTEVTTNLSSSIESSEKVRVFLAELTDGGLRLEEDFQIHETDTYPWAIERPTMPWDVPEEDAAVQSTPSNTAADDATTTQYKAS